MSIHTVLYISMHQCVCVYVCAGVGVCVYVTKMFNYRKECKYILYYIFLSMSECA